MSIKNNALILLLLLFFFSCEKKEKKTQEITYPIEKQAVFVKDSPIFIETIGHVDPIETIDIRSRVEGELMQVYFEEGTEVEKGNLLFNIDQRPYEADLKKANAVLEENAVKLQLANDKLTRYTPLLKKEYISELNYDELLSNVEALRSVIKQNEAEVKTAKLNLEYCSIYAPVTGKTGILKIDKGNLIQPNSNTPLITINQIAPIFVLFSIPEKFLYTVQQYAKQKNLEVRVAFDNFSKQYYSGELELIDNSVDTKTGMIKLRGLFKNENKELWPGKFMKTRLILEIKKNAIVVPYEAIDITTTGAIVFVVKKDLTVAIKKVKLGQRIDNNIIIDEGLNPKDEIVIKGQLNLFDGAHVFIPNKEDEK
jgi:multidrug efflux system membrane fusion protein